jgi:uncharacterized membrane protein
VPVVHDAAVTPRPTLGRAIRRPLRPTQWVAALVFWLASLFPTLLPRSAFAQGAVSGICVAIGVGVGALLAAIGRLVLRAAHRSPWRLPARWRLVMRAAGVSLAIVGLPLWVRSQNDQRELITMTTITWTAVFTVAVVSVLVAAILIVVGRAIGHGVRRVDMAFAKRMPRPAAHLVTAVVIVVLGVLVTRRFVVEPVVALANDRFAANDEGTPKNAEPPTSAVRSGGPGSLTPWDTLGYQGRSFVTGGPTTAQLAAFAGPGAQVLEPVRVYVGLKTAHGVAAQAALAVRELERTGGFDRKVLVIATATGSGFVNPEAAEAVEYMYAGDTAIVTMQYSYLPSWISFVVDQRKARESATALLDAVEAHVGAMPSSRRPMLLAYGESLGSFGSEESVARDTAQASVDSALTRLDGAFWAGPTFSNPIWKQIVHARSPESPVWAPNYDGGRQVVLVGKPGQPAQPGRAGPDPHIVYATHPSDPVTWVELTSLWKPPAWMHRPHGYDVPDTTLWFPAVTFVQSIGDLIAGESPPPGYGHRYDPNLADGWAAMAAPPGWTAADTQRLRDVLAG